MTLITKNIVEYYLMCHVSLFSDFGKMGSFLFIFQKIGLKALYYKALSQFLATNLSITPHFESSPSTRRARFLKPCRGFN
ncbi:hypothetical protein [Actinobacillus porcinus]|uniref:hypothetical protein n=1 Tax=Actinobacillus porcinus TaxID=51048 RepID=UPI0023F4F3E5|nr:hypothetical protein [Actinobacillus porcinus]MDD7544860.1 hypothetical protein [Actinobacillus porcinus]MDY5849022.1 hypothetical protein [Actinobacillus porcinus]